MIVEGKDIQADLRETADVCIIGSGAGGAVMAKELQEAGLRCVLLEEGGYYTTKHFTRRPLDMFGLLYRNMGMTTALGWPSIPIPLGRCVGGTTVINSGTCFRTPEKVIDYWQRAFRLSEITMKGLDPIFDRVEKMINVMEVPEDILGGNARAFRRGVEALGLHGRPLKRNIKGCKGCGVCVFGCPSEAKNSMELNYIPRASELGARIYADALVGKILMRGRRAVGVEGVILDRQSRKPKKSFRVDARLVVLSAGAMLSPALLLRNRICNSCGQVGKNLRIHPGSRVAALFDEEIIMWRGVPQGYYVDNFTDDRIMLEGIAVPPGVGAAGLPFVGWKQKDITARYKNLSTFGLMVSDTSKGRVYAGVKGEPFITYWMNREDAARMTRGIKHLCEIYFAAGAKTVIPGLHGIPVLTCREDIKKIDDARVKGTDIEMMAFHPTGTCRMGGDPRASVVNAFGKAHDIEGLFIADGSVIPSSMGVNPQVTIMSLATRSAFHIAENKSRYLAQ